MTGNLLDPPLGVNGIVPYGCRILAGEPPPSDPTRTITFLQVGVFKDNTYKKAITFAYRETSTNVATLNNGTRVVLADDPPEPDPPTTPDITQEPDIVNEPEGETPENTNDDDDEGDTQDDPPEGETSDCDGVIGISA
jgi:hypothetical protein